MVQLSEGSFTISNLNFQTLSISYYLSQIKPEGKIVYEYNPLRNFRLSEDIDNEGRHPGDVGFNSDEVIEAGSIIDLDTELLGFSLNNPVDIVTQSSYDGSVNLIINDNRNTYVCVGIIYISYKILRFLYINIWENS